MYDYVRYCCKCFVLLTCNVENGRGKYYILCISLKRERTYTDIYSRWKIIHSKWIMVIRLICKTKNEKDITKCILFSFKIHTNTFIVRLPFKYLKTLNFSFSSMVLRVEYSTVCFLLYKKVKKKCLSPWLFLKPKDYI